MPCNSVAVLVRIATVGLLRDAALAAPTPVPVPLEEGKAGLRANACHHAVPPTSPVRRSTLGVGALGGPRDELIYTIRCCSPGPVDDRSASVEEHLARCAALRRKQWPTPPKELLLGLSWTSAALLVLLFSAASSSLALVLGNAAFAGFLLGKLAWWLAQRRQDPGTWPRVPWACRPGVSLRLYLLAATALFSVRWDLVDMAWWVGGIGTAVSICAAASARRTRRRPFRDLPGTLEEALYAFAELLFPLAQVGASVNVTEVTVFELMRRWPNHRDRPSMPAPVETFVRDWTDHFGRAKRIVLRRAGLRSPESVSVEKQVHFELHDVGPERAEGATTLAMRCRLRDIYLWGKPQIDPDIRYLVRVEVALCCLGDAWLVESPFPDEETSGDIGA